MTVALKSTRSSMPTPIDIGRQHIANEQVFID